MADASVVHIFLDVNTALHFKRADQINWCALAGATQVVLVVAPVFLRELEHQKVHNSSRKLRERADSTVKWLVQFLRSPRPVRPSVTFSFLDYEPHVDFAACRLSPTIVDDQLIAAVLEDLQAFAGRVLVATADVGLEVKLRARRIEPLLLPDDLRLPAEPDSVEKELQQTRQELARLKSRLPRLELSFDNGADRLELTLPALPSAPSAPPLSEIRAKYPPLAKPGSPPPRTDLLGIDSGALAAVLRSFGLSAERIDRYNQDLERLYAAYSSYLKDLLAWEEQHARSFEVNLILFNGGTAPASDIDIVLGFPEDIDLFESDDLPKRPEAPEPPQRPAGLELVRPGLFGGDVPGYLFRGPLTGLEAPDLHGLPTVDRDRHQVSFSLRSLKHEFRQTFRPFHCRFPGRKAIRSFHVDFHASAAELLEASTGQLHLIVK